MNEWLDRQKISTKFYLPSASPCSCSLTQATPAPHCPSWLGKWQKECLWLGRMSYRKANTIKIRKIRIWEQRLLRKASLKHSCYLLCFIILFFNLPPRGGSEQQQEIGRGEMKEEKMQLWKCRIFLFSFLVSPAAIWKSSRQPAGVGV